MSGSVKNMGTDLVKSKTLLNIVMPNSAKFNRQARHIFYTADKAGFLRQVYSIRLALFGDIQRELASFVIPITNFFLTMPNSEKVSAVAQGASIATVSARKRVSKPVQAKPTKRYYQVTFYAVRKGLGVANLYCSHPFLAISSNEALGMALDYLKSKWPGYSIDVDKYTCYPLNVKSSAL